MTDDLAEELRRLREQVEALDRRVATIEEETEVQPASADDDPGARSDSRPAESAADDATGEPDPSEPTSDAERTPTDPTVGDAATDDASEPTASEPTTEASSSGATAESNAVDSAAEADTPAAPDEGTPAGAEGTTAPPDADAEAEEVEEDSSWEQNIGRKWLPLAGAAALVVGVVFLVQVAIDQFTYLARVGIGTVAGLAMIGIGRYVAEYQGYVRWGRITAGAGLAIAYFSVYAAYGFETYRDAIGTPLWAVLLAQTVLVGGAIALSVRDRSPLVAGQSFLLGYGTAFLALDSGSFLLTPTYVLLLTAGLVGMAVVRSWRLHLLGSVLPTYLLLGLWVGDADPHPASPVAVGAAAVLLYVGGSYALATADPHGKLGNLDVWALTVLNGFVGAFYLDMAVRRWLPDAPVEGIAVLAVAAVLLAAYVVTATRAVRRDDAAGTFGVLLAGFGVVIAGGTFTATVGLLAVLCAAVALADRFPGTAIRNGAHLVAMATAYKLVALDAFELPALALDEPVAALTSRAASFALAIAVFYGLAWWWARTDERFSGGLDREISLAAAYATVGTGLTVIVLALELSNAGVSVGWALFGLVLVAAGLLRDLRGIRLQGMALLLVTTAKVFLLDTSGLDLLARTISFLVLGVILMVTSYAYARWQDGDGESPLGRLSGE